MECAPSSQVIHTKLVLFKVKNDADDSASRTDGSDCNESLNSSYVAASSVGEDANPKAEAFEKVDENIPLPKKAIANFRKFFTRNICYKITIWLHIVAIIVLTVQCINVYNENDSLRMTIQAETMAKLEIYNEYKSLKMVVQAEEVAKQEALIRRKEIRKANKMLRKRLWQEYLKNVSLYGLPLKADDEA